MNYWIWFGIYSGHIQTDGCKKCSRLCKVQEIADRCRGDRQTARIIVIKNKNGWHKSLWTHSDRLLSVILLFINDHMLSHRWMKWGKVAGKCCGSWVTVQNEWEFERILYSSGPRPPGPQTDWGLLLYGMFHMEPFQGLSLKKSAYYYNKILLLVYIDYTLYGS